MKKYTVVYSKDALYDLKRIYSYASYVKNARKFAKDQDDRIRKEIRSLNMMPERYPIVDWEPWKSLRYRQVGVSNHLVFYSVDNEYLRVEIVRIYYAGMDIEEIIRNS